MANPLADAIRRIVGFDPTRSKLSLAMDRGKVLGTTGIGFMQPDKVSAGSVEGGKDEKLGDKAPPDGLIKPPFTGNPGGNVVDATDPSKSIYSAGDGDYSPESFINPDGMTTLKKTEDFLSGVGMVANGAQGGGTLNGLTGITDCISGKSLAIRLDGVFVPPTGWADAETPPGDGPAEHWELGTRWFAPPSFRANNPLSAAQSAKSDAGQGDYTNLVGSAFDGSFPHAGGNRRYIYTWEKPDDETHDQVSFYAQDETCTPVEGDLICPDSNPASPTHWPEDDEMALTRNPQGTFGSSPYEPLADRVAALASGSRTTLDFCFNGGTKQGRIEATNDGGYMIYETLDGSGVGIYKIFGSDNRVIGYADAIGAQAYRILPGEAVP